MIIRFSLYEIMNKEATQIKGFPVSVAEVRTRKTSDHKNSNCHYKMEGTVIFSEFKDVHGSLPWLSRTVILAEKTC